MRPGCRYMDHATKRDQVWTRKLSYAHRWRWASTTTQSLTIAPAAYGNTTHEGTTQVQHTSPSQPSITAYLGRDQYECIITGRKLSGGSGTEVVPIIPLAFANHPSCR